VREPDLTNPAETIRAYRLPRPDPGVGPIDWQAGLTSWFIEADPGVLDPLGLFTGWFVGGASLADRPGVPPAKLHYPGAQYELSCWTLDPDKHVTIEFYERRMTGDLSDGGGILMQPVDIVYQWHGTTDRQAEDILGDFVRAVVIGGISPCRPPVVDGAYLVAAKMFDTEWKQRLDATVEHYWTAGTHVAIEEGRA
jgi:hypothetical protein